MAELAKSYITVTDESAYGAGTSATVPLYIIATEGNKVLDTSTGEIAPGTTMANELLVMTSQKDVINTFGIPTFEEINGTVQQGSELNEVGLLGLYSAMGSSALGYAVRADIDLKQLQPTFDEPKSKAKNGTKWFDVKSSQFAVYRKKSDADSLIPLKNWDKVDVEVVENKSDIKEEDRVNGKIIFETSSKTFLEYIVTGISEWYVIGSDAWKAKHNNRVSFTFDTHMNVPEGFNQDSIWIQTTSANDGTKLVKKTFNSIYDKWISSQMYMFKTIEDAENGDILLTNGSDVAICDESVAKFSIKKYKAEGEWEDDTEIKVQISEPDEPAADGTLWFDDSLKVDIMVNNGNEWVGLSNYKDFQSELYVSADEPEGEIKSLSVWVDTNDTTYPTIYRYVDGAWIICDNTDQTTAMGVLFADARHSNATFKIGENGKVECELLTDNSVDEDCPKASSYPKGMLLFNTRYSGNNVKKYDAEKGYWITASGNATDGTGLFGANAQRKMVVDALKGAVTSCEELSSTSYDFFYATCPGYPEVDDALAELNKDKKEMFYIVSDTPKDLKPTVRAITDYGTNRATRTPYMTRQYPPMGMSSNVDGASVAIPTSIAKMKNLLNLPTGQICAGTQYGVVTNIGSTGYITEENEYAVVSVNEGLGDAIVTQSINPILMRRNTGLLFWGEYTENDGNTSLSDEHAILTLLRLKRELDEACTPFFFRKNTTATRSDFNYVLRTILSSYVANEEIYDYVLDTDTPNNAETISRKEMHANIAVELVKSIEFIYIPIKVVNTGTLSEQSLVV